MLLSTSYFISLLSLFLLFIYMTILPIRTMHKTLLLAFSKRLLEKSIHYYVKKHVGSAFNSIICALEGQLC